MSRKSWEKVKLGEFQPSRCDQRPAHRAQKSCPSQTDKAGATTLASRYTTRLVATQSAAPQVFPSCSPGFCLHSTFRKVGSEHPGQCSGYPAPTCTHTHNAHTQERTTFLLLEVVGQMSEIRRPGDHRDDSRDACEEPPPILELYVPVHHTDRGRSPSIIHQRLSQWKCAGIFKRAC